MDQPSNQTNLAAPTSLLGRFHNVQIAERFLCALQADNIVTETKVGVFTSVTNQQLTTLSRLTYPNLGLKNIDFLYTKGLIFANLYTLKLANNNFGSAKLSFERKVFLVYIN